MVVPVLAQAFGLWASQAPLLRFDKVDSGGDIALGVGPLSSSVAGTVVVGRTTPDGRRITFNNSVLFKSTATGTAAVPPYSLLNVAAHEIGHSLGLLHATGADSIMFGNVGTQETLSGDDASAIRALYGWPAQRPLPFGTEQAPALCACGSTLAMVWRGQSDDRNLYIATSADGLTWTPQRLFRDISSIGGPALAWDGSRLWMVWRGTSGDEGLYFKTSTDFFMRDNPAQTRISNVGGSSHGPRIAIINGIPTMVWKGMGGDAGIFISEFHNGSWQGQSQIPGIGTAAAPAICEDIAGGTRLVWRGLGTDQRLWTTSAPAGTRNWSPQATLSWPILGNGGGNVVGTGTAYSRAGPALAVWRGPSGLTYPGEVRIYAAWRGAGDEGIWFSQLRADGWSAQARIPSVGTSEPPSIACFGDDIRLAWKGIVDDPRIYTIGST